MGRPLRRPTTKVLKKLLEKELDSSSIESVLRS